MLHPLVKVLELLGRVYIVYRYIRVFVWSISKKNAVSLITILDLYIYRDKSIFFALLEYVVCTFIFFCLYVSL